MSTLGRASVIRSLSESISWAKSADTDPSLSLRVTFSKRVLDLRTQADTETNTMHIIAIETHVCHARMHQ